MSKVIHLGNSDSSCRNLVSDLLNTVDNYEMILFVGVTADDGIYIGHTDGSTLEKAGIMAFAQNHFLDKCYDD
jgi:hypothetical protein